MQKARDYRNLKETEHAFEASKQTSGVFKDYSLAYIGRVNWGQQLTARRLVRLSLDSQWCLVAAPELWHVINNLMDETDEDGWIPRAHLDVRCVDGRLSLDSTSVNQECLRDTVVWLRIGDYRALVDLEELLRATRYT
jgi:hypothetical protein